MQLWCTCVRTRNGAVGTELEPPQTVASIGVSRGFTTPLANILRRISSREAAYAMALSAQLEQGHKKWRPRIQKKEERAAADQGFRRKKTEQQPIKDSEERRPSSSRSRIQKKEDRAAADQGFRRKKTEQQPIKDSEERRPSSSRSRIQKKEDRAAAD
ncbi:hypothetical protein RB195_018443 [Necator americanus]|uniref:Uncharacterized protein n=1 Tax=Necator americanus TaxID=51031 RepID=A0ABR1CC68_NECAM